MGVAAAAPVIAHCGGGSMNTGPVDAGAVASYSVGTFLTVGSLIVARDAMGLYAYSNVCTHQGYTIPIPVMGVSTCPGHASQFDANGDLRPGPGPATINLPHYPVMINSGRVMVDTSMTVTDRTTRTPVV
jgi:Rieske Fe-S protein